LKKIWYVLVDESGDLGRGERSSNTFVLAASVLTDPSIFRNIAKRTRRRFRKESSKTVELKHHKANERIAICILRSIADSDVTIYWNSYDKKNKSQLPPAQIYGSMLADLLLAILNDHGPGCYNVMIDRFSKGSETTARLTGTLRHELIVLLRFF
jgi:hypothetical protein